jgi:hypothetical protein
MDALKFAFEILTVGVLALPWIAILIRMLSPNEEKTALRSLLSVVPDQARNAVAVALTIAVGYLAGSAVSRVSRNFFNDELWGTAPTEEQIRSGVYYDEYCTVNVLAFLDAPTEFTGTDHPQLPSWLCTQAAVTNPSQRMNTCIDPTKDPKAKAKESAAKTKDPGVNAKQPAQSSCPENAENAPKQFRWGDLVDEMFSLQESALLLRGLDKVDRLKQYHDQISILRGAAFNGVMLFFVCILGMCAYLRARLSEHRTVKEIAFLPAIALILVGSQRLVKHVSTSQDRLYTDPPLAELILLVLGVVGVLIVLRTTESRLHLPTCAMAIVLVVVSLGGWWWTEVMYDLLVIHSVPVLEKEAPAVRPEAHGPEPGRLVSPFYGPGMDHCGGVTGPNQFNKLASLRTLAPTERAPKIHHRRQSQLKWRHRHDPPPLPMPSTSCL